MFFSHVTAVLSPVAQPIPRFICTISDFVLFCGRYINPENYFYICSNLVISHKIILIFFLFISYIHIFSALIILSAAAEISNLYPLRTFAQFQHAVSRLKKHFALFVPSNLICTTFLVDSSVPLL